MWKMSLQMQYTHFFSAIMHIEYAHLFFFCKNVKSIIKNKI